MSQDHCSDFNIDKDDVEHFVRLLYSNLDMIAIPNNLISFCQLKFRIGDPHLSEEIIRKILKILNQRIKSDSVDVVERDIIKVIPLSTPDGLKSALIKCIVDDELFAKSESHSNIVPFLTDLECKKISSDKYLLHLRLDCGGTNGTNDSFVRSYIANEEQMTNMMNEMDKIRQQLFESVGAA